MRTRIAIGSHLISPRDHYSHHGIYVGRGRVVHYSGKSEGINTGPVEQTTLAHFAQGFGIRVKNHKSPAFLGKDVVKRARSRIGEDLYSLAWNNCEHFCEWCIHDIHQSKQIGNVIKAAGSAAAPALLPALPSTVAILARIPYPPVAIAGVMVAVAYCVYRLLNAEDEA